jgi:hypothetical protein
MRRIRTSALLLCAAGLALAALAAEEPKKAAAAPTEADLQAMMKAQEPGEAHRLLADLAGKWKVASKVWMDPSQPPMTSEGTSESVVLFGGRFLEENFKGTMMGIPFQGRGTLGYDNKKQRYVGTWIDSMTTSIFTYTGNWDEPSKSLVCTGSMDDPMTGQPSSVRLVTRIVDKNTHVFEWYAPGPDGKEVKGMELTYTRM